MTAKKGLCLLLILTLLCFSLLGCKRGKDNGTPPAPTKDPSQKESALAVASAARDFLSSVTSYRETVTTKLSLPYDNTTLIVKNTDDVRYYGIGSEKNFYCEQSAVQTLSLGGAEESETVLSGYQSGKMYQSDGKNALCSPITADEYAAFISLNNEQKNYLAELADSEKVGYQQTDSGYCITFTDLSEEKLSALKDKFLALENLIGNVRLLNVSVTVNLDKDGRPQETKMNFSFSSGKVSMSVVSAYSEWNSVPASPSVSLASYRETGDLRKISEVAEALDDLKQRKAASFTVFERTEKESLSRTTTDTLESSVTVASSPSYSYVIRQTVSTGATLSFTYRNGEESVVTTLAGGEVFGSQSNKMSEADAKAKIAGLLGIGDLASQGIFDVTADSGSVSFDLGAPDVSEYEKDYTVLSSSAVLKVQYSGDAVSSYTYTLYLDGVDKSGSVALIIEKTVKV